MAMRFIMVMTENGGIRLMVVAKAPSGASMVTIDSIIGTIRTSTIVPAKFCESFKSWQAELTPAKRDPKVSKPSRRKTKNQTKVPGGTQLTFSK